MKEDFNVNNPTTENVEYAIKNLLFYVSASASIEEYKNYNKLYNEVLAKIYKILPIYFNMKKLKYINSDDLMKIKEDLMDLDWKTKLMNSYYGERALLWIEAIITLRQSEINLDGDIVDINKK